MAGVSAVKGGEKTLCGCRKALLRGRGIRSSYKKEKKKKTMPTKAKSDLSKKKTYKKEGGGGKIYRGECLWGTGREKIKRHPYVGKKAVLAYPGGAARGSREGGCRLLKGDWNIVGIKKPSNVVGGWKGRGNIDNTSSAQSGVPVRGRGLRAYKEKKR